MKRRNYHITIATNQGHIIHGNTHALKTAQAFARNALRDMLKANPSLGQEWLLMDSPTFTKQPDIKRVTFWHAAYLSNTSVRAGVAIELED